MLLATPALRACRSAITRSSPAPAGLNLVLISRTESKLQDCAAELRERYGVDTRICPADLSKATPDTFAKIGAALEGLEARRRPAVGSWVLASAHGGLLAGSCPQ